jgi:hypothetical protein
MINAQKTLLNKSRKLKEFAQKYEKYFIPGMLISGLLVDFITFKTLQVSTALTIITVYLVTAGAVMFYVNLYEAKKISSAIRIFQLIRFSSLFVIQFLFGALLSASFIFYWFSSEFSISWPVILLIAGLIIANEKFRDYYIKPTVQFALYYFILFSVFSILFPFVFNKIGGGIFLFGGVSSLIVFYLYIKLHAKYLPELSWANTKIKKPVLSIFVFMNLLYFFHLIPPIPLSVRDAGVYHGVERLNGNYQVTKEKESILAYLIPGKTIHLMAGGRVYLYSSIFAPADLKTKIVHEWLYYDEDLRKWVNNDELSYRITGGRQDGYRGYSVKSSLREGKWRIDIKTDNGQTMGRVKFRLKMVDEPVEFVEVIK